MDFGKISLQGGKVNPTNLLSNGSFEYGDPPTGWTLYGAGATRTRSTTQVKIGTYSLALTRSGTNCSSYQNIFSSTGNPTGKTYTLGCWVYQTVANTARVGFSTDGTGGLESSLTGTINSWIWHTVTTTIGGTPTNLTCYVSVITENTTAYFDGAMVNEGSSPYAFSEPAAIQNSEGSAIYVGNRESYVCRAWVKFNGTGTIAILGSGNVSSITDNGTGNYAANFTTGLPDAYGSMAVFMEHRSGVTFDVHASGDLALTYAAFRTISNGQIFYDPASVFCTVFR